jgi:Ras family
VSILFYFILKKIISYLSRQVDSTDGEKLAKENGCAWIETSAKTGLNISAFYLPFPLPRSKSALRFLYRQSV